MPQTPPLVSVLLPYKDSSGTLEEAAQSVLAERGVPLELVAVNDGSTDGGPALLSRLAASDARIVLVDAGGVGISGALARGAERARGGFLARMDGDDVSLPGRLPLQVEALERDRGLGAVGTLVEAFPEGVVGEGMRRYVAWQNAIVTPEEHARELFVEAPLCHPSVMMRRQAYERVGGYTQGGWAEDYDLWLRLDAAGYALAKVPRVLLRWRHREGRATFADSLYARSRFYDARAHYLAPKLAARGRPVLVWGAGKTGKRLARALESRGVVAEAFVDIDPRKIGSLARGAPILAPEALVRGAFTVVVAVGARGARDTVRGRLAARGFVEGEDYVCAA